MFTYSTSGMVLISYGDQDRFYVREFTICYNVTVPALMRFKNKKIKKYKTEIN